MAQLFHTQYTSVKEIIDEEERDDYPEQESENSEDEEDAFFNDLERSTINGEADVGFEAAGGEGVENDEQRGSLRKADLAAVGWDANNAMAFGSPITIEMANVINYNASVAAQKQAELKHAEREIESGANIKGEVGKAPKSIEQRTSVVLEEGAVRTKGPPVKSTSSEKKENVSPDDSSRRVTKSPAESR